MLPMTRVGRAVEKGETHGFMKIAVDTQTRRILGAAILGVGGDEAIHCVLDVMMLDAPYTALQRSVHIHPTVAELIPTLLSELRPMGPAPEVAKVTTAAPTRPSTSPSAGSSAH